MSSIKHALYLRTFRPCRSCRDVRSCFLHLHRLRSGAVCSLFQFHVWYQISEPFGMHAFTYGFWFAVIVFLLSFHIVITSKQWGQINLSGWICGWLAGSPSDNRANLSSTGTEVELSTLTELGKIFFYHSFIPRRLFRKVYNIVPQQEPKD